MVNNSYLRYLCDITKKKNLCEMVGGAEYLLDIKNY